MLAVIAGLYVEPFHPSLPSPCCTIECPESPAASESAEFRRSLLSPRVRGRGESRLRYISAVKAITSEIEQTPCFHPLFLETALPVPRMLQMWCQTVLTFSQVIHLARALPRPQDYGQSSTNSPTPCSGFLELSILDVTAEESAAASVPCISAQYPDFTETIGLTLTSPVTLVDANLQLQVVTSTDLPPVQIPTSTSATQSSPDTSGVSHS
jgi:hypothetical protein